MSCILTGDSICFQKQPYNLAANIHGILLHTLHMMHRLLCSHRHTIQNRNSHFFSCKFGYKRPNVKHEHHRFKNISVTVGKRALKWALQVSAPADHIKTWILKQEPHEITPGSSQETGCNHWFVHVFLVKHEPPHVPDGLCKTIRQIMNGSLLLSGKPTSAGCMWRLQTQRARTCDVTDTPFYH